MKTVIILAVKMAILKESCDIFSYFAQTIGRFIDWEFLLEPPHGCRALFPFTIRLVR